MALPDRSTPDSSAAHPRQPARPPQLWRVLYELVRFAAFGLLALQLAEWLDDGTAFYEATRRGVPLAQVLAERDAASGMWAFGDMLRAACLFVLMYALWPAACVGVAGLTRRLQRRRVGVGG